MAGAGAGVGGRGVAVVVEAHTNSPSCVHGPTVMFERFLGDGSSRRFYACAACRDRKDCPFFLWADHRMSRSKRELWARLCKEAKPRESHRDKYKKLEAVKCVTESERAYCNSCCTLLTRDEVKSHSSCSVTSPVTDTQLAQPSTLLPPKENAKMEAQYLFAARSVEVLVGLLQALGASGVLCVGSPRVHEALTSSPTLNMASLMLDIDDRYFSFFSPESFLRYNMFNHHFFEGRAAQHTYHKFLAAQKALVVVSDPPFGGRMELLTHNLARIEKDWQDARDLSEPKATLPVLFVFPYFLEAQVVASLPSFTMLDYQVEYDNHPLYSTGPRGMKHGSAVRVFTNQCPSLLPLPQEEGYRWCHLCQRWVYAANTHCEPCGACTSKDGRTYKHCEKCGRCVKPSWLHCASCHRCQPQDHSCQETPVPPTCHVCGDPGHKRSSCPKRKSCNTSPSEPKKKKKKKTANKKTLFPQTLEDERRRNLEILAQIIS